MSNTKLKVITTDAGRAAMLDAESNSVKLKITHVAVGNSGYTPAPNATALKAEKERVELASSKIDLANYQLNLNAALDSSLEYWVREVGFYAGPTLVYLWSAPESEMSLGYKSAPVRFLLGMSLKITDSPLASVEIIDQGQPLELSLTPLYDALKGVHARGEQHNFGLPQQHEAVALVESDNFEYQAEILRGMGQSGVYMCRQYTAGGAYAWQRPFDVPFAALNIHSHWDLNRTIGMAEISAVVNGYYIRTRHNDYTLAQPAPVGSNFLALDYIDMPDVPADVVGTPDQQISKMQQYFKALHGEHDPATLADYSSAFQWGLTYFECWFETFDESLDDTFDSGRHVIDASSIRELLNKVQYFNYGGHKNRLENLSYFSNLVRFVDDTGVPRLATLKYRIACQPVGSVADYPIDDLLQPQDDLKTAHRFSLDIDNTEHRAQRFSVRQTLAGYDNTNSVTRELIDELMEKVPGMDGAGAVLSEQYTQYGTNETINAWLGGQLNAAYYNRSYKFAVGDASNRTGAKRGYNDPTLWVAKNTRTKVTPLKLASGEELRFSYAMPLELVLLTPLMKFNPHGVPELTSEDNPAQYNPKANATAGRTSAQAVPGYHPGNLLYYHTPSTFYTGGDVPDADPADTALKELWMRCADGAARKHTPSGTPVFLPLIGGMTKRVRMRYPIYYQFHEGSHAAAELSAYKLEISSQIMTLQNAIADLTLERLTDA